MIYASVMLEKWPNKGLEFFKYMDTVRQAAARGFHHGWVKYDEQYRLRKEHAPSSSWGIVDMELWMLCVCTPNDSVYPNQTKTYTNTPSNYSNARNDSQSNGRVSTSGQQKQIYCRTYNKGLKCEYGKFCKFTHKCSKCNGLHPYTACRYK